VGTLLVHTPVGVSNPLINTIAAKKNVQPNQRTQSGVAVRIAFCPTEKDLIPARIFEHVMRASTRATIAVFARTLIECHDHRFYPNFKCERRLS